MNDYSEAFYKLSLTIASLFVDQAENIVRNISTELLQLEGKQNIEALYQYLHKAQVTINNELSRIRAKGV